MLGRSSRWLSAAAYVGAWTLVALVFAGLSHAIALSNGMRPNTGVAVGQHLLRFYIWAALSLPIFRFARLRAADKVTIARSKFTVRPDALARRPVAPKIETFTTKRVFTDGERTVELHSTGPTAHADEMVIFYFPREKILFQGDMFSQLESGGMPPAVIEVNRELVRKVEALGLRVETLVGVHAGALPWQTFRDAVARQPR